MYNGFQKIEAVIEEIEANITEDINYERLASAMALSLYEFRRIFSFIVGCPLSDYIRKRRLSLAACELSADKDASIQTISAKYGYSTEAAFSKAFREQHGVSPSRVQKEDTEIKIFTKPEFKFTLSGRSTASFSVKNDTVYGIKGFKMTSPHSDTCCCEAVWGDFYDKGYDGKIVGDKIYASYRNEGEHVLCTIGERVKLEMGSDVEEIPKCSWACFKMNTTDDDTVNEKYGEILYEVLPSAKLRRIPTIPTVEVYPIDMSSDNFEWEIRIPVEKEIK